jgi:ribosomal protein L29
MDKIELRKMSSAEFEARIEQASKQATGVGQSLPQGSTNMRKWKIVKRCTVEYTTDVEAASHADAVKAGERAKQGLWKGGRTTKTKVTAKAHPIAKNESRALYYTTFLYLSEFHSRNPNDEGEVMFYVQERSNRKYFNDRWDEIRKLPYEECRKAHDELLEEYVVNKEPVWAKDYKDAALKLLEENPRALIHEKYFDIEFAGNNKIRRNNPLRKTTRHIIVTSN